MNVEARELYTKETDSRGRLYLGTEYANKRVTVAVVEVDANSPSDEELASAYRDAAAGAERLSSRMG
ncbi:MAG: hypothetical protein U5J98_08245 [Halobacteriales archaeon]|nr:hypothetical protein [Halobacteriales archaeon]